MSKSGIPCARCIHWNVCRWVETNTDSDCFWFRAYEEQQQWIPCSERLPEKNGDYLVTMEGMCRPYMRFLGYSATSKKWGYGGVIAWMDVKPYKE